MTFQSADAAATGERNKVDEGARADCALEAGRYRSHQSQKDRAAGAGANWPAPAAGLMALRPAGGFGVILADPPWRMRMRSDKGMGRCPDGIVSRNTQRQNSAERHYRTMPIEEIKALPVEAVAAPNCVLLLWTVDPLLPRALEVGASWGFEFKTVGFYWAKTRRAGSRRARDQQDPFNKLFPMGTGYWTRANPEMCLLFTRGEPARISPGVRKLIVAARREHSRKPDEQYDRIERLCGGPYLELFARSSRPGWKVWGNEVDKFEVAA